jgi:hypothetical protein
MKEANHKEDRPNDQDVLTYPMPRRRRRAYSSKLEEKARWRSRQSGRPPPSVLLVVLCCVFAFLCKNNYASPPSRQGPQARQQHAHIAEEQIHGQASVILLLLPC